MAPTATSLAALAGGIAFCVGIATAALLILRKARACDILGPVVIGGALRLGVMVVVHLGSLHTGDGGLLFLDDWTYLRRGALLARPWTEGHIVDPAAYEYAGTYQFGFQALVASIFVLVGRSIIAVKLVNVMLGTATVLLVGMLADRILGEAAKRRATWLAALLPGLVWWSAPMMKEALATFLVVAALLAAASLPKRSAAMWLCLLLPALVIVRTASALAVGTGIGVALAIATAKCRGRIDWRRVGLWTAVGVLVIAAFVLVVSKGAPGGLIEQYRTTVTNMIDAYRRSSLVGLPGDALKALVTPLPWTFDDATRNWDRGLYPGVWGLYILYPLAAYGCWRMRRRPELALLAVPIVVTLVLNALSAGFVVRQRSTLEPLIAVLAIAGLVSWGQAALWAALALVLVATTAFVQSHSPLVFASIIFGAAAFLVAGLRLRGRTLPSAWPDSRLQDAVSGSSGGDRSPIRKRVTTTLSSLRLLASRPVPSIVAVAGARRRAGDALRRLLRADVELTQTSRLALAAAGLLLLVFATLAVTTARERLAFERDVQQSFARTIQIRAKTLPRSPIGSPTCRKTATYRFKCTVPVRHSSSPKRRVILYQLRARDDGCWQAVGGTDEVKLLPQNMSACMRASTLIYDRAAEASRTRTYSLQPDVRVTSSTSRKPRLR